MARAFPWPVSLARLVPWVLLLFQAASAAALYDLEVSNNGPITTDAQATLHAILHVKNEGSSSTQGGKYCFNWIYGPLTLVEKLEHGANATIVVTTPFPGIFPVSVQVTHVGCWFCPTLTQGLAVLQVSEYVQQVQVKRKFLLTEKHLIYTWTVWNDIMSLVFTRTALTTVEPFAYHNYSTPGTCVVHLQVTAEWRKHQMKTQHSQTIVRKTGHFAAALELLDAVQSINIVGSTEVHVMENLNFSLHIQGSPPLSLCWLIKTECVSLEADQCHLMVTNATDFHLNHVFRDAGQYCLSVRVENGINMLQSFREIQVKPLGIHPAFFVLPCLTLLSVMLGLAVYVTFRSNPQQKDLVE
ncbi:hypothetical protein JRQ81_010248, partial [Phrynocephalus forsythii]